MEVIQSFTVDHTRLKPGIYISRKDKGFTTFDLRIIEPNKEPAVAPSAMHSMEHLMATWFRNSEVKEEFANRCCLCRSYGVPYRYVYNYDRNLYHPRYEKPYN